MSNKLNEIIEYDASSVISTYLKDKKHLMTPNDSLNIELFLSGGDGWKFFNIPAPSIDELHNLIQVHKNEVDQEKINTESLKFLSDTDWLIIRELDCGIPCPSEVKQARAEARSKIIK